MKRLAQFGLLTASLALSSGALADPSYGDIGGPGVYFGNGNVDGNWTINTQNNIQVALRAKDRSTLQTIDGSSGIYQTSQGLFGGNKALWNYEFSINLRADGTGTRDFTGLRVLMGVDIDPGQMVQNYQTLNVLNNWPDTAWWDGSAPRIERRGPVAGEYGAQQSANPLFSDSGFNFNPGPGYYDLSLLVVDDQSGEILDFVVTTVHVVPEPSAFALVAIALGGLGFASRRRQQRG